MNYAAGLLVIAVGVLHIIFGESQLLAQVRATGAADSLIGAVRVMSLQGGAVLIFVGALHILVASRVLVLHGKAAFIPLAMICLNLGVFLAAAAIMHRELIASSGVQFVLFAVIITLQILALGRSPEETQLGG